MKRSLLVLALCATSGCTILAGAAGAGITAAHNSGAQPEEKWSYVVPVVTGAAIGLVIDFLLLRAAGQGLGNIAR